MTRVVLAPSPLDDDGYPTDEALRRIETWDIKTTADLELLMAFVENVWWMPDWGFKRQAQRRRNGLARRFGGLNRSRRYWLSTGGWSGNESIIQALQSNFMFWALCWEQSRKGGHYIFDVPVLK